MNNMPAIINEHDDHAGARVQDIPNRDALPLVQALDAGPTEAARKHAHDALASLGAWINVTLAEGGRDRFAQVARVASLAQTLTSATLASIDDAGCDGMYGAVGEVVGAYAPMRVGRRVPGGADHADMLHQLMALLQPSLSARAEEQRAQVAAHRASELRDLVASREDLGELDADSPKWPLARDLDARIESLRAQLKTNSADDALRDPACLPQAPSPPPTGLDAGALLGVATAHAFVP